MMPLGGSRPLPHKRILAAYPHHDLAKEINVAVGDSGDFSSQSHALARKVRSKEEVDLIFSRLPLP